MPIEVYLSARLLQLPLYSLYALYAIFYLNSVHQLSSVLFLHHLLPALFLHRLLPALFVYCPLQLPSRCVSLEV
jgi:hypothetical protein